MKLKDYGGEMLKKQLKGAEKKRNTEYAEQIKAELNRRDGRVTESPVEPVEPVNNDPTIL